MVEEISSIDFLKQLEKALHDAATDSHCCRYQRGCYGWGRRQSYHVNVLASLAACNGLLGGGQIGEHNWKYEKRRYIWLVEDGRSLRRSSIEPWLKGGTEGRDTHRQQQQRERPQASSGSNPQKRDNRPK